MPELAEVEFYRRRWHEAAIGQTVDQVHIHAQARVFRDTSTTELVRGLTGACLVDSDAAAKQMIFHFAPASRLGIHLGMSGELSVQPVDHRPRAHDHLVLMTAAGALVFSDPRMFGAVRYSEEPTAPEWWSRIAPSLLSRAFTRRALEEFLHRRARAPLKAVLLMQERFPGIGNWMADEILWRAALHPAQPAGTLTPKETATLWKETRTVCRLALRYIAGHGGPLPPDLNVNIPATWLFSYRWSDGGRCPRTGVLLQRAEIGGRTSCWSPARQRLRTTRRTPTSRDPRSP